MALKLLYDSGDEFTARALHDLLQQEGIGAMLKTNIIAGLDLGLISKTNQAPWQVFVEETDHERAIELLGAFMGSLGELAETNGVDDE